MISPDNKRFQTYLYLIQEREAVRLKKEAGEDKPWTSDPILQQYRFTNVRRMDDKVSVWLLRNWYEPYFDHPNMLYAAMTARFFNLPDALAQITDLVFSNEGWPAKEIATKLRIKKSFGDRIFNNAYMVRGNDGQDKVDTVVNYTIQPMVDDPIEIDTQYMSVTWSRLFPRYGMGSFMAGQIVADLRWAMSGAWEDRDTWAPAGPGSSRGICWLHYQEVGKALKQEEFIKDLIEVKASAEPLLPESITSRMEMIDWQNTLCEFDKYMRVTEGRGRPKQRYPGV